MATGLRTYAANEVEIIVGGHRVEGYAQDSFCTIAKDSDTFTAVEGADGDVGRAMQYGKLYTVTINLLRSSGSNDHIMKIHEKDVVSGGRYAVALSVTDLRGTSIFRAGKAFVTKTPDNEYGNSINNQSWVFKAVASPTESRVGSSEES